MLVGEPGCGKASTLGVKPNPSLLVLSNRHLGSGELGTVSASEDCWIPTLAYVLPDARSLKYERVIRTGVEISSDGSYFLNQQMPDYAVNISRYANSNFGGDRTLDDVSVRRRPIDTIALRKEINAWVELRTAEQKTNRRNFSKTDALDDGPIELTVIVNEKAVFSALGPILKELRGPNIQLGIAINASAGR